MSSTLLRVPEFWDRVNKAGDGGCWNWTGRRDRFGYGHHYPARKPVRAHRFSYELLIGPIPHGLVLDHLCRNTSCVNPEHLEPVTDRVNVLRGIGPSALNAAKVECIYGHPFTPENTRVRKNGQRQCRTCERARARRWKAQQRGKGVRRGLTGQPANADKTHCKHGHEFTPENTRVTPSGARECRECQKRRQASWRTTKAELAPKGDVR